MKAIPVAEIRERFLRFFEARGHVRLPSDSLVPANDPTLLFTGAGMNQFKDEFLGKGALPHRRVTTAQKCLRVPDLENVGLTPRHHTFFEMLGNFSFGDYFKKECIAWEWEFFSKELGIPERQMVATVYEKDDEAYEIWRRDIGLEPERIFRFGAKENFWPADAPSKGPNGPCGPCSEIYFDNQPGAPYPDHAGLRELPEDRFTEIGNCVFTQFDRRPDGTLAPLPQKNIDVGLGLERIAAVLAGAKTNFDTDIFQPLIQAIARRCGIAYGKDPKADVRMRRIADHIRALVFCIADGATPSNEGRGYVVRKILRRACRDGYELGIEGTHLHQMVDLVGELMGDAYPEIREHRAQCKSLIASEEESFASVYQRGRQRLDEFLAAAPQPHARGALQQLPGCGEFAFELHDTYGFPVDITRQMMNERGFAFDEAGFEAAMEAQRERARASMATSTEVFAEHVAMALRAEKVSTTRFVGYEHDTSDASIFAVIGPDNDLRAAANAGEQVTIVVDVTPFYAQSGGQVGDTGRLVAAGGSAKVLNTTVLGGYWLHAVAVESGVLRRGDSCRMEVDAEARRATERNHTATHLLHAALKKVLGPHVSQAGSEVAPTRLRFDYTHGEKLTAEQIAAIEAEVNAVVLRAIDVRKQVKPLREARAEGFVAMFGEKYADEVRTIAVGDFSRELCGGTHVANSGSIGPFRIVSDAAISAGTRRIEAVTGTGAIALAQRDRAALAELSSLLKVPPAEAVGRVAQLTEEVKRLRKELDKATAVDLTALFRELETALESAGGVRCAVFRRDGLKMKEIQELLARAKKQLAPFAGVVLSVSGGEVLLGAAVSPEAVDRVQAGALVQTAAQALGGGGGGKPDMAQGKGRNPKALPEAEAAVRGALSRAGLLQSR
jgi:alanyl-tRNA synthetase